MRDVLEKQDDAPSLKRRKELCSNGVLDDVMIEMDVLMTGEFLMITRKRGGPDDASPPESCGEWESG